MNEQPVIVDPFGNPARAVADTDCPKCGAGPDKRRASAGMGVPSTVCSKCGHDFQEAWRG